METVRAVLSIAAQNKWKVYQMDVKSAFLNGVLMEEIYIEQPPSHEKKGQEHKVCTLKKDLYGLKQAPREWYNKIDSYLLENGFEKFEGEPTLYIKENDGEILIVVLYVDDVIFIGNDDYFIEYFKTVMKEEFEMTDMGLLRYFLGIEVEKNTNGIFISQAKYVNEVLERFNMQESKAAINHSHSDFDPSLYKSIVGSLMYLTATKAEYAATTAAACQAVWMRMMLSLGQEQAKGTVISCDNSSAIALSKNSVFHKRTKHIDTRFHYIKELVNNGEIVLQHCKTQEQVVDILTKPLGQKIFESLRKCLGMTDNLAVEIKGEC
eukprot:PITA_34682